MESRQLSKRLKYAYPSSPYAVQLGFGKDGCWLVESIKGEDIPSNWKPLKGFSTYAEAYEYSKAVPGVYDFYCFSVYHAKTGFVNAPEEVRTFHLKGQTS